MKPKNAVDCEHCGTENLLPIVQCPHCDELIYLAAKCDSCGANVDAPEIEETEVVFDPYYVNGGVSYRENKPLNAAWLS